MKKRWPILVVDDEEIMRDSLAAWLAEDGFSVDTACSGAEAIAKANLKDYAIYFIDLKMPPGIDGIETMREVRRLHPRAPVVIMTAYATVDTAIAAMKEGAYEYVVKPCNPEEISLLVARLITIKQLEHENVVLRQRLAARHSFADIIAKSPRMREIFALIRDIADLKSTVLIQGESGTGKELIARAIHGAGARASQPFIGVSCGALTDTLLESELFGHERGAFTGAYERRRGKFELAEGGTLFLDEIGEVSPRLQIDLLRVLQERSFFRVGGSQEVKVDVRVIVATRVDIEGAVASGAFRDDLFYRLNVIGIKIPPLRERREDIRLLARHFLEHTGREVGREVDVSHGALKLLVEYDWPGNVRELENAIERAVVTSKNQVLTEGDFGFLRRAAPAASGWQVPDDRALADVEREVIAATLRRTAGNIKEAAASLGIDRSTLYDKMKRYGITRP